MNKKKRKLPKNIKNSIDTITVGISNLMYEELSEEEQIDILNTVEYAIVELRDEFSIIGESLGFKLADYNISYPIIDATEFSFEQ